MNQNNPKPMRRATKGANELRWLEENREWLEENYPGQWLAVKGYGLAAADETLEEVAEAALKKGVDDPLFTAVRSKEYQGVLYVPGFRIVR